MPAPLIYGDERKDLIETPHIGDIVKIRTEYRIYINIMRVVAWNMTRKAWLVEVETEQSLDHDCRLYVVKAHKDHQYWTVWEDMQP